jgi:hypothetical protein
MLALSCQFHSFVRPSVRAHWKTRLPLDGFWWHFIYEIFSKISQENSSFTNPTKLTGILHEDVFTLWQCLAEFFLERETFEIKVVEKIKTHLCSVNFSENRAVYEIVWKNMVGRKGAQIIWRLRVENWISKPTHAQLYPRARAPTPTHPHAHICMPSPTRTHTQKCVILITLHGNSFVYVPQCYVAVQTVSCTCLSVTLQYKQFRVRASVLRCITNSFVNVSQCYVAVQTVSWKCLSVTLQYKQFRVRVSVLRCSTLSVFFMNTHISDLSLLQSTLENPI